MKSSPRLFYGYVIAAVSFLILLVMMSLPSTFGLYFKPMSEEFGWTRIATSGAVSLSGLMGGLIGIFMGKLNDKLGPRVVVTLCGLLCTVGYLLMWNLHSLWQLYLFYGILIGAGSMVIVPVVSTIARWFPSKRSLMTGLVLAGSGIGMMIMPLIISRLIEHLGWRVSFLIPGIVILIVGVLGAQLLKRDPGKLQPVAAVAGNPVKVAPVADQPPLTFKEAMATGQFWLYFVIFFISGFYVMSIQVHVVPYATDMGITAAGASTILAIYGAAMMAGQIGMGHVGDKIGYKRAFLIGTILTVIAVFVLMSARELWAFYVFAVILGLAFGDCDAQESSLVAWTFGLESHGMFYGFSIFSFTIGGALGLLALGYIFDTTGNYNLGFILFAVLSVIAVILTLFLKPAIAESVRKKSLPTK